MGGDPPRVSSSASQTQCVHHRLACSAPCSSPACSSCRRGLTLRNAARGRDVEPHRHRRDGRGARRAVARVARAGDAGGRGREHTSTCASRRPTAIAAAESLATKAVDRQDGRRIRRARREHAARASALVMQGARPPPSATCAGWRRRCGRARSRSGSTTRQPEPGARGLAHAAPASCSRASDSPSRAAAATRHAERT